jgi:hypothetical protein
MLDIHLETKLIERFVVETKRDRYLGFIRKASTRPKFIADLCHAGVFREELFRSIAGHEQDAIHERLRSFPHVSGGYVISQNPAIDGKTFDIATILNEALSPWADTGTVIIFGNIELVYREAEGPKNRWLST